MAKWVRTPDETINLNLCGCLAAQNRVKTFICESVLRNIAKLGAGNVYIPVDKISQHFNKKVKYFLKNTKKTIEIGYYN